MDIWGSEEEGEFVGDEEVGPAPVDDDLRDRDVYNSFLSPMKI